MEHVTLMFEVAVRLLLAMCIGGGIGWERARSHHPAGIRTHMLVTIGAAVVMLLGSQTVGEFAGTANSDPARLGAQVISGIGFLGAGTIMKEGRSVRGLTTAATLWVAACLGLAMGAGQYVVAFGGFLVAMLALRMFKFPRFEVSFLCSQQENCFQNICQTLELEQANISNFSSRDVDEEHIRIRFELYLGWRSRTHNTADILARLSTIPYISRIEISSV
ncbi:MAG: MgtC/SapB family protein [Butyricicoccus sp.]|nr:MgtC/SapB family protein [Butyricicoccus sp.]